MIRNLRDTGETRAPFTLRTNSRTPCIDVRFRPSPFLLAAALLAGCATAPRWPAGRSLLDGVTPTLPKPPDSLRASLELTALAGGARSSITAVLSAKPGRAYKLDLFGFPGVSAGGFLWRRGSLGEPDRWELAIYDKAEYLEGAGPRVDLGPAGIGELPVHDLFSWVWGDYFPGDTALAGLPAGWARAEGGFAYPGSDGEWRAELDPRTGLPLMAFRADSAFRLEFGPWRAGAGAASPARPVPRRVRLYRRGEPLLEIKVSLVEDNPAWKRDPFALRIPKGFRRVDRMPGP